MSERPRRLRRTPALRALTRAVHLSPAHFIYPVSVHELPAASPIPSIPGVSRPSTAAAAASRRPRRTRVDVVRAAGRRGLQGAGHRRWQRVDPLGRRKRLTFPRPAARLLGTPPMAEVSLDEVEITQAGVEGASEIVAVCR